MSLQELSPELLHLICDFCTRDELQDLRLTSRWLRDIANQHLLPEVVACVEDGDLATMRKIASLPFEVRNGVRSFCIQADQHEADIDREPLPQAEWLGQRKRFIARNGMKLLQMRFDLQQRRRTAQRDRLSANLMNYLDASFHQIDSRTVAGTFYKKYVRALYAQDKLVRDPLYYPERDYSRSTNFKKSARALLAACPNISSLCINWGHTLRQNAGISNAAYLRSLTIPQGSNFEHSNCTDNVTKEALLAANVAGLKIRNLAIAGATPFFLQIKEPRSPELVQYYQILIHVEKLHLVFNGADADKDDYDPNIISGFGFNIDAFAEGSLVEWLQNCNKQLRELRLVLPKAPFVNWKIEMKHIMADLTFSNLNVLHLARFQTSAEDIERCLLRHRDSLLDLSLRDAHLEGSNWPDCLSTFAGKLGSLRFIKILGPWTSRENEADEVVVHYLGDLLQTDDQAKKHQEEVAQYIIKGEGAPPYWNDDDIELIEDDELSNESEDNEDEDEGDGDSDEDDDLEADYQPDEDNR